MSQQSRLGFPTGRVAATLRSILHRELRQQDAESITVVLLGHLLVDDALSACLYDLLSSSMPRKGALDDTEEQVRAAAIATEKMEQELWERVRQTSFAAKLGYLEPCFRLSLPDLLGELREVNRVRNGLMHGKGFEGLAFRGVSIWSEDGIERYFMATQAASMQLGDFRERIAFPLDQARRWAERLKQLGEPLF